MRKIPIPTLVTAAALVAVLLAYAFSFQVRFNEVAVKVRFGKADASSVISEPGFYFRWPWPVEAIEKYDRRLRVLDAPEGEIKTHDGKNVIVGTFALWKIKDPLQFFVRAKTVPQAEEQLRARLKDARATVIGNHQMAEFVSLDAEQVQRGYDQIERQMLEYAAPAIDEQFGVTLVRVDITRISLPEDVTQKVFEGMIQEREALATTYRGEGQSRAEAIKAAAESSRKQILDFAESLARRIESAGVQASTRILAQIKPEDSEFFIWLRWLDALKISLKEKSTIFLDSSSELYRHFAEPPTSPASGE